MHPSTQVLKYSGTQEGERGDGGNGETTEGEARSEKREVRSGKWNGMYSSTQVLRYSRRGTWRRREWGNDRGGSEERKARREARREKRGMGE
jgi:hypothetical protein